MKFIGVDLTSAFPPKPRRVDVAVLDDDRNVTFHQFVWPDREAVVNRDPASLIGMILHPLGVALSEPFILAIDGPQGLASLGQTQRACEQILATPGRTPFQLPPATEGLPFQGYIRSSIDLFATLVRATDLSCRLSGLNGISRAEASLFEVFPGAEWVVLAGRRLARKTTVAGRQERLQLFRLLGIVFPAQLRLPTADQNDALAGSYLAWCVRHKPNAVDQKGAAPTTLDGEIREGFILHATAKASVSTLVAASQRAADPTPEEDIVPLEQPVQGRPEEDWNEDEDLLLLLTDNGLVHGGEPENAWLDPGINYVLDIMPPDSAFRFHLNHSPTFAGGRGWCVVPHVQPLLAQIGRPAAQHLSRQSGATLRVQIVAGAG